MNFLEENARVNTKKDGFYNLEADQIAVELFYNHVLQNSNIDESSYKQLKKLIDEGYIKDFIEIYGDDNIKKICSNVNKHVKKNPKKYESFMQISKFYRDYALKTGDNKKYLEHWHNRILHLVLDIYTNKKNKIYDSYREILDSFELIYDGIYQPATPTFLNAGKVQSGEKVSCFLLEVDDSLNSINFNINSAMQLSKGGGGVALNLSNLRSRGEPIKGYNNASKGVIPVVKILEDSFNYADQMGQRKGAGAVYLNIFHADILDFINTKKINADEKSRIQTLSLGVLIPDRFFELTKNNEKMFIFKPYSVYKATGISFADIDITKDYDMLVSNDKIEKIEINARDLLLSIVKTQFESGYPYLIFIDNMNKNNPLSEIGRVKMSNLCTEIAQIQKKSVINDYGVGDEINYDINCVLGSLNVVKLMESPNTLEYSIRQAFNFLSLTSDSINIKNAPTVKNGNKLFHSVGLGIMNLHGYYIRNNIMYESDDAKEFLNQLMSIINYYTLYQSNKIAISCRKKFHDFDKSNYSDGSYFDNYLSKIYKNKEYIKYSDYSNDKLKQELPNLEDWEKLMDSVKYHGLYNSYRLCIAPTQSISYLANATQSMFPIVDYIETRTYGNSTTYYPAPYLTKDNMLFYKNVYKTDMRKMIDLVAIAQLHVDQAISTVLYVNSETTKSELMKLYIYAWQKGLKSLYYTRNKNLTIEECLSCGA